MFSPLCLSGLMTDWIRVGRRDALDGALGMKIKSLHVYGSPLLRRYWGAVSSRLAFFVCISLFHGLGHTRSLVLAFLADPRA